MIPGSDEDSLSIQAQRASAAVDQIAPIAYTTELPPPTPLEKAPEPVRSAVLAEAASKLSGRRRPGPSSKTGQGISAPSHFERAHFEARLHELKFLPSGDTRVVILVPEADALEVVRLREAYACALSVVVEKQVYGGSR